MRMKKIVTCEQKHEFWKEQELTVYEQPGEMQVVSIYPQVTYQTIDGFGGAFTDVMGRTASGVKGMTLDEDNTDEVVGMICIKDKEKETVLVVSEQGYGKRSSIEDYRITNRGGKGVKTINITEKTGKLVAIKNVTDENDLMIINKSGIAIRMKVADLNVIGRATQGVRLINLEKRNDEIASVCKVLSESEEEIAEQKAEQEARQENEGREFSENQASLGTDVDLPESEEDNEQNDNEEITE